MTIPELVDRLQEINDSLNMGSSIPKMLNEYTVNNIQKDVRTLISDLEDNGKKVIEWPEGHSDV